MAKIIDFSQEDPSQAVYDKGYQAGYLDGLHDARIKFDEALKKLADAANTPEEEQGEPNDTVSERDRVLNRSVKDLELTNRILNCFAREGITTVGQLASHSAGELLNMRSFGYLSLGIVKRKLDKLGLSLRTDPTDDQVRQRQSDEILGHLE